MANNKRQRSKPTSQVGVKKIEATGTRNGTSSSSAGSATPVRPASSTDGRGGEISGLGISMTQWRSVFGCCCLAVACYFGYVGYLETRINTPFDDQKMVQRTGLDDPDRYWGSYRSGVYFGMKTRDPYSLVMGMMWYYPQLLRPGGEGIRHWCDQGDNLDKYGWTEHDGRSFGVQEIVDGPIRLETSFIKFPSGQFGGDWTARINISQTQSGIDEISLVWYVALDEKTIGSIHTIPANGGITGIHGETKGLGEFVVNMYNTVGAVEQESYLSTVAPNLQVLRETITKYLRLATDRQSKKKHIVLAGENLVGSDGSRNEANFIAVQLTVKAPFTLDIAYHSTSGMTTDELSISGPPVGVEYSALLTKKREQFTQRFEESFDLQRKGYPLNDIKFAQAVMSNMVGGIGYFYGASRVQSVHTKESVPYWKAPLYTAVPSRSFFPRGFLWDEGFHGLLISSWDIDIELDIISHWFDLMNVEGWIPREQILGVEALAKVPEEFVTQRNTNANPPTFFLTLKKIINKNPESLLLKGRISNLDRLFPRLQAWFTWFNSTQKGDIPGTYRWRGRDSVSTAELNPKTLTSGLDDYPRASHPTDKERHIDLRCWIAFAAGVMADLARLLRRDDDKYQETYNFLTDNTLMNELHLSPYSETYSDWGLHTDSVVLKRPQINLAASSLNHHQQQQQQPLEKVRFTLKNPELRFVDSTYGYVSLFPFLLEILNNDSPYLVKIFKDIRDPNLLWTDFGIRSLSKTSPLYMKRNTEHDPPYWRGQIWININYLILRALHFYGSQPGPYSEEAKNIYVDLRYNIVQNIIKQYRKSGYIWEQYNDKTGEGSGCRPFTGWSGLVVSIMAEQY